MGALVESEQVTDGPTGAGSRFRDLFEDYGQRVEVHAEVVRFEPGRLLEVALAADAFQATSRSELDEAGDRTRLAVTVETEYTRRGARLLAPVVTRHAQARLERDLTALRELLEGSV